MHDKRRGTERSPTVAVAGQDSADVIARRREIWAERPLTREVYRRSFAAIGAEMAPGPRSVEIGGGSGMARDFLPDVLVTDLVRTPHVDLVADALALPFASGTLDNLIGTDCLHHLPHPDRLFIEAIRVLRPGGRLILVEPFISPASRLVFALAHPEPVDLGADPLPEDGRPVFADTGPFAANQAIPTLLFFRHRERFARRFPELRLATCRRTSLIAYPLSGGFSAPSLVPRWLHRAVFAIERMAAPLAPLMAFRVLITLERTTSPGHSRADRPSPGLPPTGR
jgi:SAM-dependent methyltransferase